LYGQPVSNASGATGDLINILSQVTLNSDNDITNMYLVLFIN